VDLLTAFLELCCSSVSKVQTFLGQMRVKHEELAAVRVEVTGKEYQSAILKSIPEEMSKFASGLLTSARMFAASAKVDPDILIDNISEEADHLTARCKCDKSAKGRGQQGGAQNEALAATGEVEDASGRANATTVASLDTGLGSADPRRRTTSSPASPMPTPMRRPARTSPSRGASPRHTLAAKAGQQTSRWDPRMLWPTWTTSPMGVGRLIF
jgi:hypothetical protein